MKTQNYTLTHNGDRYMFQADLASACSPVLLDGSPTPFQTADARHDLGRLRKLLHHWLRAQGA